MVAEFYDVENEQRTEDEISALRQVRAVGGAAGEEMATAFLPSDGMMTDVQARTRAG
jgi:hypothetical protein